MFVKADARGCTASLAYMRDHLFSAVAGRATSDIKLHLIMEPAHTQKGENLAGIVSRICGCYPAVESASAERSLIRIFTLVSEKYGILLFQIPRFNGLETYSPMPRGPC